MSDHRVRLQLWLRERRVANAVTDALVQHQHATPERVEWLMGQVETGRVTSPVGYVRRAIEQGWEVPAPAAAAARRRRRDQDNRDAYRVFVGLDEADRHEVIRAVREAGCYLGDRYAVDPPASPSDEIVRRIAAGARSIGLCTG